MQPTMSDNAVTSMEMTLATRPPEWSDLPTEIKVEVISHMVDSDPAGAMRFYGTCREATALMTAFRCCAFTVDDAGRLTRSAVPLVAYARSAVALGQTDPLRLFLADSLRTLKALANWHAATCIRWDGTTPYTKVRAVMARGAAPLSIGDRPDLSALIDAVGPLADDLPAIVRHWYDWMTAPDDVLFDAYEDPRSPLAARQVDLLGYTIVNMGYPARGAFCDACVMLGAEPRRGDTHRTMRFIGVIHPPRVKRWLGDGAALADVDAWIGGWGTKRNVPASKRLCKAVSDRPHLSVRVMREIGERVRAHTPDCLDPTASPLPLERLFAPSRVWLGSGRAGAHIEFLSPAIGEALALAGAPPSCPQ